MNWSEALKNMDALEEFFADMLNGENAGNPSLRAALKRYLPASGRLRAQLIILQSDNRLKGTVNEEVPQL